ncbi:hypothetical protein ACFVXC_13710 [Streptomyces sp. NPDC058257]
MTDWTEKAAFASLAFWGGRGFIGFLAVPRHTCVYLRNVTWYG